jgi:hypothetical protein
MNGTKPKSYGRIVLLVLALFIAGFAGYKLGSYNMCHKWIEASQKTVPIVIDYVLDRYAENPSLAESHRDLITSEGELLFAQGTYMLIDPEGYLDYLEKYG